MPVMHGVAPPGGQMIRDSQLFLIVGSLVMVDTSLFLVWQVLHPFTTHVLNTTTQVLPGCLQSTNL